MVLGNENELVGGCLYVSRENLSGIYPRKEMFMYGSRFPWLGILFMSLRSSLYKSNDL